MAQGMYFGQSSVAREIEDGYIGIAGVARKLNYGYFGVSGVAREFLGVGTWERYSVVTQENYIKEEKTQVVTEPIRLGLKLGALQTLYVTYSSSYTFDSSTGKFTLVNPKTVSRSPYNQQTPRDITTFSQSDKKYMMYGESHIDKIMYYAPLTGEGAVRAKFYQLSSSASSRFTIAEIYNTSVSTLKIIKFTSDQDSISVKGSFIDTVTAPLGTYPDDGEQDGYWYVKV